MAEDTNCEKLASVMNRAGQQGKAGFIKMLWSNQTAEVQSEVKPLLNAEALQAVEQTAP